MKKRFILNEDFDSDFDSSNAITLAMDPTNPEDIQVVDIPMDESPSQEEENIGVTKMLSDLIKDEWEAIDGYKSTIATLTALGGNEELIKVLEDISTEEMVHVGQLEKCMTLVSPEAVEIKTGEEEAEEQLKGIDVASATVEESCKKHKHKPLKEDFTYSGKGYEDYIAYWMDEALSEVDYLIDDGDSDDETVQLLRELNDDGIEELCNRVATEITNSDYLWEQINERIFDGINNNIQEIADEDEYRIENPTEIELPKKDKEEEKPNED